MQKRERYRSTFFPYLVSALILTSLQVYNLKNQRFSLQTVLHMYYITIHLL